jgi:prepilin-type N-terminal cleavage/methylation domain-containing protein
MPDKQQSKVFEVKRTVRGLRPGSPAGVLDSLRLYFREKVGFSQASGHSLIELLIVVALIGVVTSLALPQLLAERRLSRSVGVTREIMTQLRYARQLAMSRRQSVTFQYDDLTKQIKIINHNNNQIPSLQFPLSCVLSRQAILGAPGYPLTACSVVVTTIPLVQGGMPASELAYGMPALPIGALPNGTLSDGIAITGLVSSRFFNVTFQPDGSVIDTAGDPDKRALFIYNTFAPRATASAISIMGASGRVKIWRYDASANRYVE